MLKDCGFFKIFWIVVETSGSFHNQAFVGAMDFDNLPLVGCNVKEEFDPEFEWRVSGSFHVFTAFLAKGIGDWAKVLVEEEVTVMLINGTKKLKKIS